MSDFNETIAVKAPRKSRRKFVAAVIVTVAIICALVWHFWPEESNSAKPNVPQPEMHYAPPLTDADRQPLNEFPDTPPEVTPCDLDSEFECFPDGSIPPIEKTPVEDPKAIAAATLEQRVAEAWSPERKINALWVEYCPQRSNLTYTFVSTGTTSLDEWDKPQDATLYDTGSYADKAKELYHAAWTEIMTTSDVVVDDIRYDFTQSANAACGYIE